MFFQQASVCSGGFNGLGLHCCLVDSDEDTSDKSMDEDHQQHALEELTNLQFKFEVKEVCCWLWSSDQSVLEGGGIRPAACVVCVC